MIPYPWRHRADSHFDVVMSGHRAPRAIMGITRFAQTFDANSARRTQNSNVFPVKTAFGPLQTSGFAVTPDRWSQQCRGSGHESISGMRKTRLSNDVCNSSENDSSRPIDCSSGRAKLAVSFSNVVVPFNVRCLSSPALRDSGRATSRSAFERVSRTRRSSRSQRDLRFSQ